MSHLGLSRDIFFGVKGNSFFSVHKLMSRFNVWLEAVIQIACFATLMCCIRYVVNRMIEIILLASPNLVFSFDKLSDILYLNKGKAIQ